VWTEACGLGRKRLAYVCRRPAAQLHRCTHQMQGLMQLNPGCATRLKDPIFFLRGRRICVQRAGFDRVLARATPHAGAQTPNSDSHASRPRHCQTRTAALDKPHSPAVDTRAALDIACFCGQQRVASAKRGSGLSGATRATHPEQSPGAFGARQAHRSVACCCLSHRPSPHVYNSATDASFEAHPYCGCWSQSFPGPVRK